MGRDATQRVLGLSGRRSGQREWVREAVRAEAGLVGEELVGSGLRFAGVTVV